MPQIIFEHSANLLEIDYSAMYQEIYEFMKTIPDIGTCKMRSVSQPNYYIATDKEENAFAFLRILMATKSHRGDEFCEQIMSALTPVLEKHVNLATNGRDLYCKPTIEVGFLSKHYTYDTSRRNF